MRTKLPTVVLEGVEFIVDVKDFTLKEKVHPTNVVSFAEMKEITDGYLFEFRLHNQASATSFTMPEWVVLDREGMADKYKLSLDMIAGKSDYDLMVDQYAFDLRVNKGQLPTITIAGHLFYVDLKLDKLRPKDDFISRGIVFSDIEHYYSEEKKKYIIPYNPKTHEFQEFDDNNHVSLKKLIAIQFPFYKDLDPIGWNRLHGYNLTDGLKQTGVTLQHKAVMVPWEKAGFSFAIAESPKQQKGSKNEKKSYRKGL